jgi:hypothetical protein
MWLGESEKTIAGAFEEAADLRAFLIIDEADSLLRDRLAAQHSWEITQVNEMLTQRTFGRGGVAAISFQGAFSIDDCGSNRQGVPALVRRRPARLRAQAARLDPGRFRDGRKESERTRRA